MYHHVEAAWSVKVPSPACKLVLLRLAEHANKKGVAWPSAPTLVKETGLGLRTVYAALDRLVEAGVITLEAGQKPGTSQRFVLSFGTANPGTDCKGINEDEPLQGLQPTLAGIAGAPLQGLQPTLAGIATETTKKQPIETTKKQPNKATTSASPQGGRKARNAKPEKTDTQKATNLAAFQIHKLFHELFAPMQDNDASWMSITLQKQLRSYQAEEIAGTLRAVAAQKPNAKTAGLTVSFKALGLWVEEWLAADRPAVLPTPVQFLRSGGTNDRPTSRLAATSQRATDRDGWRQLKQSLQTGGMAASAG